MAQNNEVTGTVTDAETGETLPGVNIVIEGTTRGAATDAEGRYTIPTVESGLYTLVATYVGYVEEVVEGVAVAEGETATVNFAMQPAALGLDEVVVTALGLERKKRSLGYATQEISGESLTKIPVTNFVSSLKGKIPGVRLTQSPTPGGSVGIIIRGANSLAGNNQPLIIVDGVPIDNQNLNPAGLFGGIDYGAGLGNINANDIESITILKGPNAAAIYGAQAANGAIVVTTKSGNAITQGVGISFTSNLTFQQLSTFPTFQNKWAGGYDDNWSAYGTTTIDGKKYPVYPGWLLDNWGPGLDGTTVVLATMPEIGPVPLSPQPEDNVKNFFDTGVTFTNSLALSGGNDATTYRVSISDLSNKGMVPTSTFSRNTVNLRVTTDITDRLRIDGKANYIRQEAHNRSVLGADFRNPFQNLILLSRFVDLDWLKDYKNDEGNMINWKNGLPMNPYWVLNELTNNDSRNRLIGFISANYNFTHWLDLRIRTAIDTYTDKRFRRAAPDTPGDITGSVDTKVYNLRQYNSDFILTAMGDVYHNFIGTLSLGGRHLYEETDLTGYHGENLLMDGLYHISNTKLVDPLSWLSRKAVNSLYAIGRLGYKNYLFLNLTGRNDWSSTLGEDNRSFFYPSASLSFVFSDAFGFGSDIFSYGKLRASYARTGTDAEPYLTKLGYNVSSTEFSGQNMAFIESRIPLANLKNELTISYEIGTDLWFFNNRLGIDFTYYTSSTLNQILPVDVSVATGFAQRVINAGEIENEGIELLVRSIPVRTHNFQWDLTFNFTKNKSTVVSLAPGVESYILISSFGANIEARPGEPFGNIVGYEYKRNEKGQKIVTPDGRPQRAEEQSILGNIQPDWLGGISNTFHYKGFSLSTLLDIRQGGEIYSYSKYDQMAKGTGKFTEDRGNLVVDGVVANEDGTYTPNTTEVVSHMYYAARAWGNIGEEFVVDASYIALRQASIGYSFSPDFLSKTPFVNLEIALVGKNLFYIDRADEFELMGIAPESAFNRSAPAQGFEARNMPLPRSYGIHVNMRF